MLDSVLVANRGEIARRVIRTARRMGIKAVAVYSDADADLPYVGEADEAVHIGPSQPAASYLNAAALIEAAGQTRAAAVHPGYGFLAENADFARQVIAAGLTWVGPDPEAIDQMGDKIRARNLMERAGVPVAPGTSAGLRERMLAAAVQAGEAVGYRGAGTVECLVDADAGSFVFLEMNTRLQVEHPVTELVTGIDLVEQQFLIAAGESPSFNPAAVRPAGHAIELRIYAEDPVRFLPGPGTITEWDEAVGDGVRVDAGYQQGNTVTPFYDTLLAKLC